MQDPSPVLTSQPSFDWSQTEEEARQVAFMLNGIMQVVEVSYTKFSESHPTAFSEYTKWHNNYYAPLTNLQKLTQSYLDNILEKANVETNFILDNIIMLALVAFDKKYHLALLDRVSYISFSSSFRTQTEKPINSIKYIWALILYIADMPKLTY